MRSSASFAGRFHGFRGLRAWRPCRFEVQRLLSLPCLFAEAWPPGAAEDLLGPSPEHARET